MVSRSQYPRDLIARPIDRHQWRGAIRAAYDPEDERTSRTGEGLRMAIDAIPSRETLGPCLNGERGTALQQGSLLWR
jgi:hypothetical protein